VKKLRCVLSLPGDNIYLREQTAAAKAAAHRLGVDLLIVNAENDSVVQSQQLLEFVQSRTAPRPDAILLEPVNATGLPRVAEEAVAQGIAWVVSNAQVAYLAALRRNAKAPVFLVSQDHLEVGRIQGRQIAALLPKGGSVLYLRGPATNALASKRFDGLESVQPKNVEVKTLKIQWTAESAQKVVSSWLALSTVRPEGTQLIASQNADFIFGARKAFESLSEPQRAKWLAVPCLGVGVPSQAKPLVDQGVLRAAALTSLTLDRALDLLVKALNGGAPPAEQTFVEAHSYPPIEDLAKRPVFSLQTPAPSQA
jgi:ABC-type sugar transport system substrate-binding protein